MKWDEINKREVRWNEINKGENEKENKKWKRDGNISEIKEEQ